MSKFVNANINAGKFFIRKSKLASAAGKKMPDYYIEVFDKEGVSLGTTGVWENSAKDGSTYLTGDLSFTSRDSGKTPYKLVSKGEYSNASKVSTDPYEGRDNESTKKTLF